VKKHALILVFALIGVLLTACGVGLNIKQDEAGNTVLDVSLPESVVNTILQDAVLNTSTDPNPSDQLLNQIDSIDMKPGLISVAGKRTLADGTQVNGTFDLSLSADNGQLRASVSNVQVAGDPVSQEAINQINERIASSLAQNASDNSNSEFNSVTITDDALQFVVTIKNT
jgi:hypothetical protein